MAAAFYWECEALPVALAPWRSDLKQQLLASARVAVAEQWTPGFALRFELELDTESGCRHLMRLVNQRQILRAFEFAFVGSEAEKRRAPVGEEAAGGLNLQVKTWLGGGGRVQAPPKEELARWLLTWMLLAPAEDDDEWLVLLCGETGAEDMDDSVYEDSGDCAAPISDSGSGAEDDGLCDDSDEHSEDDLPPPYEYVDAGEAELSEEEGDNRELDREVEEDEEAAGRPAKVIAHEEDMRMKLPKRGSSIRTGSSRSFESVANKQKDKLELKATIVQINARQDALDVVKVDDEPSSEWSEDRRRFQHELRASRRDLQVTKQQCEKVERLAQVRHSQLLKDSARKLRANDQKRRDAKAARQMIADTLEYRDELHAMESRLKQASIAAHREQERIRHITRVVVGNTENPLYSAVKLGPGPLSKKEIDLLYGGPRDEIAVYDHHGRRRNLKEAGQIATESSLKSAMGKLRRLFLNSGNSVDTFRRYDLDRSGSLSYAEFQRMLRENGTELSKEQSKAIFKCFDADESGEVDYIELLWGFFDCEAFLKRWHERKSTSTTTRTEREMIPIQTFQQFDRTSQGVLPVMKFQLVLDNIGVTLSETDAQLLAIKFDAGKDGYVDYLKFLDFVQLPSRDNAPPDADKADSRQSTNSRPDIVPPGMERIWKELQSLSATQAKLHRLLR